MTYTTPTTASGQILTSAIWNASVRDNLEYLKERVDGPARCSLSHNTTQSIANNSNTLVAFNTDDVDSAALHDTVTNNSRITVPTGQDGFWLFTATVEFDANTTGVRRLLIRANGTTVFGASTTNANSSDTTRLNVAMIVSFAAASYAELVVYQNSGGALNLTAAGTRFAAQRIA